MLKRFVKIALCALSFCGFFMIAFAASYNFSLLPLFNGAAAVGTGLHPHIPDTPKAIEAIPYEYINPPRSDSKPLGLSINRPSALPAETGQAPETPLPETDSLPEGALPVISLDMSEQQSAGNLAYRNESKYSPDLNSLAMAQYPISHSKLTSVNAPDQPTVLIIHTHGTECYLPDKTEYYLADTPTRSADTSINVVAVGKALAQKLNEMGVSTLHCETMFDADSYSDSYDLSEKAVLEYLERYPSIQYVFDVHRDSIVRGNGEKIKPQAIVNGLPTAQAMLVVGTDSSGADHPDWMTNLTVATHFQSRAITRFGNLMRPINIRAASFNAEHTPGSVLIEVGTCGNTISEALNCASLLGETIADVILNQD